MIRTYIAIGLILISYLKTEAQTLKGQVLVHGTDSAVAHASIYFNSMYKVAVSDKDGYFELPLSNLNKGPVVVSAIGYSSTTISKYLSTQFLKVYLKPMAYDLNTITIKGPPGMSREKKEKIFKKEFLGTSYSASKCTIENLSDIKLIYRKKSKILEAFCDKPVIIHNPPLGYKITYYIDKFKVSDKITTNEGHYFFQDDTTSLAEKERKRIDQRRLDAYLGSKIHFIRSLCNRTLSEDGFIVFDNYGRPLNADDILVIKDSQKYLKVKDGIKVLYENLSRKTYVTDYKSLSLISDDGFYDPSSITWTGYMALERVGDLLPYEYQSNRTKQTLGNSSIDLKGLIREEDPLKALLFKLEGYNDSTMREKVHLHFDKPYYIIGDTIWFKSYIVSAGNNQLSNRSKVLYVELINEKDSLKKSLRLPVTAGLAWGDFILSESLTEGNYRIRAYTNWMRNFDEGFFFDKTITIGNSLTILNTSAKTGLQTTESKTIPAKITSGDINVQFFPESGNIVGGIRSKIGYKAVGSDGLGKKATGYVLNSSSEKVAEFSSEYAGMGTFSITPTAGQVYTAKVKLEDGSEKSFELPKVQPSGYVLTVNNENENDLVIKISPSANTTPGEQVIVLGQSNGSVHYVSKSQLKGGPLFASVPKKQFPGGILQLTLLNSSNQPLAERLVFIRKQPSLNLTVAPDKEVYNTRSPVKMNFLAIDSANRPLRGLFSVAVTNESDTPFDDVNESTIESNLLLSSEIKGYIETPNYYFTNPNPQKDKALDNLMLTQGWRTFDWKSVNAGKLPSFAYQPEQGISISGRVTEGLGRPSVGANIILMSSLGSTITLDTTTNAEGRFRFKDLMFNEGASFILQAKNSKGKGNLETSIDSIKSRILISKSNNVGTYANSNQSLLPYLSSRAEQFEVMRKKGLLNRGILLSDVKIKATIKKQKVEHSSNLNGPGKADAVLLAEELRNCPDLASCLQGRVAGLVINNGTAYLARSVGMSLSATPGMQLVVDGAYPQGFSLRDLSIHDIESVEILKTIENTGVYGLLGSAGVIVITTKRGKIRPNVMNKGVASFTPPGFYLSRHFYSPNYDVPDNKKEADLRSTIYWAPSVITDSDGKASISFSTADQPGTYKATIEGIDLQGSVNRQVYRFKVN
jgi:hypothetical protein